MKKTQKEVVLDELRKAGVAGVHSFDFYRMGIRRAPARIQELRDEGYNITSKSEGNGVRYFLRGPEPPQPHFDDKNNVVKFY